MKKVTIIFSICFFTAIFAFGQDNTNFPVNYNQDAFYPKGDYALMMYFFKNIKYTDDAVKNNIKGTAVISFTVLPDSSVSEVVPLSKIGYGIEEQVADLTKKLRYAPAVINGTKYPSSIIINVRINAEDSKAVLIEK
jgi:hypothetical protein